MSQDDEQNAAQTPSAKPFGALRQHVKTYKDQIEKLKQGASSGISGLLGSAAELLPDAALKKYNLFKAPSGLGASFLKDGASVSEVSNAREFVDKAFDTNEDKFAEASTPEHKVIGVFYEEGRRKFLFSDFSVVDAPEEPLSRGSGEPISANGADSEFRDQEDPLTAALLEERLTDKSSEGDASVAVEEEVNLQSEKPAAPETLKVNETPAERVTKFEEEPLGSATMGGDLTAAERVSPLEAMARAVGSEAAAGTSELHVIDEKGDWMWDISFTGKEVAQVKMADGCRIHKTTEQKKYVVISPVEGESIPRVEIVGAVCVDRKTGNFSYHNASGEHWVAYLNNGWKLEHYRKSPGEEYYVLTEPKKPGRAARNRIEVANLHIDPASGDVSFEPWDGAGTTTLRSRRLK